MSTYTLYQDFVGLFCRLSVVVRLDPFQIPDNGLILALNNGIRIEFFTGLRNNDLGGVNHAQKLDEEFEKFLTKNSL